MQRLTFFVRCIKFKVHWFVIPAPLFSRAIDTHTRTHYRKREFADNATQMKTVIADGHTEMRLSRPSDFPLLQNNYRGILNRLQCSLDIG